MHPARFVQLDTEVTIMTQFPPSVSLHFACPCTSEWNRRELGLLAPVLKALESDVLSFVSVMVANDIWVFADSTHRIIFSINLIIHEAAVGVFSHKPSIMSSFACSRGRMHDELEQSICNVRKTRPVLHKSTKQMQHCTRRTWSLVASFCFVNSPCYGWYNPMHFCFMASCRSHASLEMFKEISWPTPSIYLSTTACH
jgi:hypothetical protein